jgi:hypothetical protein
MLRPDEMARLDADSESQLVDDLTAEFWRKRDAEARIVVEESVNRVDEDAAPE